MVTPIENKMPTRKPRMMLSVPDDLNDLLERLSDLSGTPKTKLVIEMLEQFAPVLEQVLDAMEKIKSDKEKAPLIAKQFALEMLADGQEKLSFIASEAKKL